MRNSSEASTVDNSKSTTKSTKSSIADRLNRLENEINWLLTLQTSGPATATTLTGQFSAQLSLSRPVSPLPEKKLEGSGIQSDAVSAPIESNKCKCEEKEEKEEKDDKNRSYKEVSSREGRNKDASPKDKVPSIKEENQSKRPRKKQSFCQCKHKRSKSSLQPNSNDYMDSSVLESKFHKRRSKSLDARQKHDVATNQMKSNKSNEKDLCDLRDLVNELSKNKDIAIALSEQWKSKFIDMKQNCDELKALHERTQQQKDYLDICLENEKQQHELLQKLSESELGVLQKTLDDRNQHNEDLIKMCEELRNDLVLAEEKFAKLQESNGEMAKEIINKFEAMESLQNGKSDKVGQYKKFIRELQKEIDRLKNICSKNAEWACEESSEKNKLLAQIKELQLQVGKSNEKNQKLGDKNTILVGILVKLGKDDPNIQKLLQAMSISQSSNSSENSECTCSSSIKSVTNLEVCECEEARNLINEMAGIIQIQRSRINELVNITSQMIPTVLPSNAQSQKEELEQARKEVEDVKGRYSALESSVRTMRDSIKKGKEQMFSKGKSNATLENEIGVLSKQLEESHDNIKIKEKMLDDQADTIDKLKKDMYSKDDKIAALYKDLNQSKDDKNALNKKLSQIESEKKEIQRDLKSSILNIARLESIIHNLEKKVDMQKREFDLQIIVINKEKEQALRAAQFSTDKLMETMEDFRRQSDSQTQLRHVLTKLLQEKDEQLRATMDKMSSLTLDPQIVVDALKTIKPTCQISVNSEALSISDSYETSIAVRCYTSDDEIPKIPDNLQPSCSGTVYKDVESDNDNDDLCDCSRLKRMNDDSTQKWDEAADMYFDVCQTDCIIYDETTGRQGTSTGIAKKR